MVIDQGDILKVEGVKNLVLVISKPLYNESGKIIGCPIVSTEFQGTFKVPFNLEGKHFYAVSDSIKQLDVSQRGFSTKGHMPLGQLMVVIDMLESIIEII